MRGRLISMAEARGRGLADLKLGASTSLTASEIDALEELLATLRRGGDARVIARSAELTNVARKVAHMKATVATQRLRRESKTSEKDA